MAESRAVVRNSGVSGWSGYGYPPSLTSSRLDRGRVELGGLGETGEVLVDVADLELVAAQGVAGLVSVSAGASVLEGTRGGAHEPIAQSQLTCSRVGATISRSAPASLPYAGAPRLPRRHEERKIDMT